MEKENVIVVNSTVSLENLKGYDDIVCKFLPCNFTLQD